MTLTLRTPFIAALGCVVLLSGCFLRRGDGGLLIRSVSSDYSPVVTFNARVSVSDSIRVKIDRARLLSPGEVMEGMGAVTGRIEMQALVVEVNPAADLSKAASVDRNGSRKPWIEKSVSTNVIVSDSMKMGVPQTTGPLAFTLPIPQAFDPSANWLVFRITGPAVAMPARMADGSMAPMFAMPAIRVFACATKNFNGKTDAVRTRHMKESYSSDC